MSQSPVTADERQSLLAPQDTVVNIHAHHDHVHTRTSEAPKDRLQHHRAMVQDRFSFNWWFEWIIIIIVFSVTGSSTMMVVKPLMKALGITGTLGAGPWSYRMVYIVLTFPLYSCMLLLVSSLLCRRQYFEHILIRMWSRLLPCFFRRSPSRD
ncbi:hypothetical protein BGZ82_007355 [Podila clonocystis]|nr:hypothetical protein BGZ82_007355 [Podila clonocystis]